MDHFGIGPALKAVAEVYFQACRRTGRTTSLVESLKAGDRVVFINSAHAEHVRKLLHEFETKAECVVIDPRQPEQVFDQGTPEGRTIFDHAWVEQYYLYALERAARDIDQLQRESSGFGMAHVETRLQARERAKWHF